MLRSEPHTSAFSVPPFNPMAMLLQAFRLPVPNALPAHPWANEAARKMEPVTRAATRAQLETLSLVGQQARTAMDFPKRLASCRTPQELAVTSFQFWQTSLEQQLEGSRRIMSAWSSAWQSSVDQASTSASDKPVRDIMTFPDAAAPAGEPVRKPSGSRVAA